MTANRSDLFPPSTTVGVYPAGAITPGEAPRSAALTTAATDSAGAFSATNAAILSGTRYALAAQVDGQWRHAFVRSTLDIFDSGTFTATGDTTNGSVTVSNASASAGSIQAGMRITGSGIPSGTRIQTVSGATLTLTAAATVTASGVTLRGDSAYVWRAKLRRRRAALGTA